MHGALARCMYMAMLLDSQGLWPQYGCWAFELTLCSICMVLKGTRLANNGLGLC